MHVDRQTDEWLENTLSLPPVGGKMKLGMGHYASSSELKSDKFSEVEK